MVRAKAEPVTSLGPFQLENLLLNPLDFYYFDLRRKRPADVPHSTAALLRAAEPVAPKQLLAEVEERVKNKHSPLVLLCENGRRSSKLAKKLMKLGYVNVCVVSKGVRGLATQEP